MQQILPMLWEPTQGCQCFYFSCLDFSTCITRALLHRLQIQNAATRIITGSINWDHITPILTTLHWLSVHFHIDFKVSFLTFKALHAIHFYWRSIYPEPGRTLRSADSDFLINPRVQLVTKWWMDYTVLFWSTNHSKAAIQGINCSPRPIQLISKTLHKW